MFDDLGERTELATPKRRRDARERGQVARSPEVTSVLVMLALCAGVILWRDDISSGLGRFLSESLERVELVSPGPADAGAIFRQQMVVAGSVLLPMALLLFAAAVVGNVFQVGILFTLRPFEVDSDDWNPLGGLGRVLHVRTLGGLLLVTVKLGWGVFVLWWLTLSPEWNSGLRTLRDPGETIRVVILQATWGVGVFLLGLAVISVVDYACRWWSHERALMMTPAELREELRQETRQKAE